jgi:hypothetical protein
VERPVGAAMIQEGLRLLLDKEYLGKAMPELMVKQAH